MSRKLTTDHADLFSAAPWHQNAKDDVIYNDNGGQVAYVIGTRADGRLVAASPDLYAACKAAASFLDDVVSGNSISIGASRAALLAVRAALAKASGGVA